MKRSLFIVLLLELGLAAFLAATTCNLRSGFVAAMRALREHPSSASALAEFRHQQFLSELQPFLLGAVLFAAFALSTLLVAGLGRWVRRSRPNQLASTAHPA